MSNKTEAERRALPWHHPEHIGAGAEGVDDQPTTEPSEAVPLVYSVDRSWESRMRVDANDDPYDSRKMHRTWPSNDDRYGTARCSRRVILNTEDAMPADDPLVAEGSLCRRCIPTPPPAEPTQGSVLREWAQRVAEREAAPAPQPAADTEVQWGVQTVEGVRGVSKVRDESDAWFIAKKFGGTPVRRTVTRTPWEEA